MRARRCQADRRGGPTRCEEKVIEAGRRAGRYQGFQGSRGAHAQKAAPGEGSDVLVTDPRLPRPLAPKAGGDRPSASKGGKGLSSCTTMGLPDGRMDQAGGKANARPPRHERQTDMETESDAASQPPLLPLRQKDHTAASSGTRGSHTPGAAGHHQASQQSPRLRDGIVHVVIFEFPHACHSDRQIAEHSERKRKAGLCLNYSPGVLLHTRVQNGWSLPGRWQAKTRRALRRRPRSTWRFTLKACIFGLRRGVKLVIVIWGATQRAAQDGGRSSHKFPGVVNSEMNALSRWR